MKHWLMDSHCVISDTCPWCSPHVCGHAEDTVKEKTEIVLLLPFFFQKYTKRLEGVTDCVFFFPNTIMGGRFSKKKKGPADEWRQIIPCTSREPIESKYTIGEQIGKFADRFSSCFLFCFLIL